MRRRITWSAAAAAATLTLVACEARSPAPAQRPADTPAPDNTARNRADQPHSGITAEDQSERAEDVRITAEIRKAIVGADGMSLNAQNVKIMTRDGHVVLRGPVNSAAEKDAIGAMAREISGVTGVDNLLEVVSSD